MMKRWTRRLILMFGLPALLVIMPGPDPSGAASDPDKTLSPYFFVKSDDPNTDRLPLKSTTAEVRIAGVMADVTITQVYKNEGRNTLEAVYVFPASTRAAVYAMRMNVGQRIIEAEIMKRQEARQTYERARQEGRTASLLEQQRPNVFQMNVANILPGDEIKVVLRYAELIKPENKVYEFVYPAVVGPRYSKTPAANAPPTEKWVENPYLHQGQPAPYAFGLSVDLQTGIPISRLSCPSHEVSVEYSGKTRAHLDVKDDPKAGTKDFVLRYSLVGGRIETGLMLYPGRDENFFLLMMEPPARFKPEAVLPREYIFIVDVSGSMNGFPLTVAKSLMKDVINSLEPEEFMNVLLFAGGSAVLSEGRSLPATESNKARAISWIESRRGGGGTEILPALKRALGLPRTEGVSRIVVVVTDGYVSVEPQTFELIRNSLGQANLFAFGIGSSVNRHLIEGMARVGRGEPFVVLDKTEAQSQAAKFRRYIESPVLTDIKVDFEGLEAFDVEPVAAPDLFAQRPVVVFGKYKGQPMGAIKVTGKTAEGDFEKVIEVDPDAASTNNSALRLLWARHRIMRLSDLNHLHPSDGRVKEVTGLGLKYSLMTMYTSFVAVDKVKRADGKLVTVKQPLPLPAGVSDLAVADRQASRAGLRTMAFKMSRPTALYSMKGTGPRPHTPAAPAPDNSAGKVFGTVSRAEEEAQRQQMPGKKEMIKLTLEAVLGNLDRAVVEKTLRMKLAALMACFPGGPPELSRLGQVTYRFVIDGQGAVKEVKVVSSNQTGSSIQVCLKKVIESIRFPRPGQGKVTVVVRLSGPPKK